MNKNIFIYLFIGAILFNVWQFGFWNSDIKNLNKELLVTKNKNTLCQDSIVKLNFLLEEANYFSLDTNQDAIDYLGEENIKVYVPHIKEQINNLNSQPKGNPLVPMDPIDGNKFVINKIKFINHRWIIGDFSNGQMWGEVILKYFINEDKTVSFETAQHILYPN